MRFETKIAVVVRADLPTWQKLNMTAFLVSGIAATEQGIVGEPYQDGSGNIYLPMFRQPVLIFGATAEQLREVYRRAQSRAVQVSIFTEDLFSTGNDTDNRAAVRAVAAEDLKITGLAMHAARNAVDKIVKDLALHA
jgi:hypothetical protein